MRCCGSPFGRRNDQALIVSATLYETGLLGVADRLVEFAETLSAALDQSGQQMLVLGQLKSTERVAHFLAEIDIRYRKGAVSSGPLSLKVSRTEIGDYLGLTVETVSRSIGKLKKRGVIRLMGSDEVVVLDNDKLHQIAKVERADRLALRTTARLLRVELAAVSKMPFGPWRADRLGLLLHDLAQALLTYSPAPPGTTLQVFSYFLGVRLRCGGRKAGRVSMIHSACTIADPVPQHELGRLLDVQCWTLGPPFLEVAFFGRGTVRRAS